MTPPFSSASLPVKVVTPDTLPFPAVATPVDTANEVLLWFMTYHDNYGHLMGEHGPTMHNTLCTTLGRWAVLVSVILSWITT